jgi:hypothetical protein
LYQIVLTYELHRRGLSAHIVPTIAAVFCVFLAVFSFIGPNLPEETEIEGWLLPASDHDFKNKCNFPAGGLNFVLGTNLMWVDAEDRISYVFGLNKTPLIAAVKDGDRLAFDVDIFDKSGKLAVRIDKNKFPLVAGEYSYRGDRSTDRTTLIVYDPIGLELLHIKYAKLKTV